MTSAFCSIQGKYFHKGFREKLGASQQPRLFNPIFSENSQVQCHVFDVHVTVHHECILLSTTNKMQRYKIFFIIAGAQHVSGGFSAHHQELKNCTHSIWYVPGLQFQPNNANGSSSKPGTYQMLCLQFLSS
jgi:hypothetical protein